MGLLRSHALMIPFDEGHCLDQSKGMADDSRGHSQQVLTVNAIHDLMNQ